MGAVTRLRVQLGRSSQMLDLGEALMLAAGDMRAAGQTVFWEGSLPAAIADARAAAARATYVCDELDRLNEIASGEDRE